MAVGELNKTNVSMLWYDVIITGRTWHAAARKQAGGGDRRCGVHGQKVVGCRERLRLYDDVVVQCEGGGEQRAHGTGHRLEADELAGRSVEAGRRRGDGGGGGGGGSVSSRPACLPCRSIRPPIMLRQSNSALPGAVGRCCAAARTLGHIGCAAPNPHRARHLINLRRLS